MIVFSRGKITIQSHHLAVAMSSAVINNLCEEIIISDSSIAKIPGLSMIS